MVLLLKHFLLPYKPIWHSVKRRPLPKKNIHVKIFVQINYKPYTNYIWLFAPRFSCLPVCQDIFFSGGRLTIWSVYSPRNKDQMSSFPRLLNAFPKIRKELWRTRVHWPRPVLVHCIVCTTLGVEVGFTFSFYLEFQSLSVKVFGLSMHRMQVLLASDTLFGAEFWFVNFLFGCLSFVVDCGVGVGRFGLVWFFKVATWIV